MAHFRLRVCAAALVLGAVAFGLAGCGRAGPPEQPPPGSGGLGWAFPPSFGATPPPPPPPDSALNAAPSAASAAPVAPGQTASNQAVSGAPAQTATAAKSGFDANGNPVAPTGKKKPFLLDPILQ